MSNANNNSGQKTNTNQANNSNDGAFTDILVKCLMHWPWFVVSVLLFAAGAYLHLKRQEPVYTRSAQIIIKTESRNSNIRGSNVSLRADLGVFDNNSQVEDEMIAMTSPTIVIEVVNRLKLYMEYKSPGRFHDVTLYGKTLPVDVEMLDLDKGKGASFKLELKKDGQVTLSNFMMGGQENKAVCEGMMGQAISTPLGSVKVNPSDYYKAQEMTILVSHRNSESAINNFRGHMTAKLHSKESNIIDLVYNDVSIERAENCLNALVEVYNESWLRDRNQMAKSTSEFINERLEVLKSELDTLDSRISNFKSTNLIPNLEAQSGLSMSNADEADKRTAELTNNVSMLHYLQQYVEANKGKNQLIPANTGIGVASVESQISAYNTKMLARNNMVANSSEENPLVVEMDTELNAMHAAILSSIKNQIKVLNAELNTSISQQTKARGSLASNPQQNKHLLGISRQQGVKEALYLFLLQKQAENELSQSFTATATNTRVIMEPYGSNAPTSPQSNKVMLIAIALGFLLPFVIIYLLDMLDKTVRGRKDLSNVITPFAGEIPEVAGRKKGILAKIMYPLHRLLLLFRGKKKGAFSRENIQLDVTSNGRNVINEAFRVVRGNIEFMNNNNKKVYLITSANPGSGKTYITVNLSASFAVKNKRVLIIDCDLRKRSLSRFKHLNKKFGLSDYLAGHVERYQDIIYHDKEFSTLDILPSGTMPPNPSEVLYSDRLGELMAELRKEYDIIFLDCPPVEVVTDVAIIAPHADRTFFIVRAGVFLRGMIPEIDKMYESKKFGDMCVLLNGTEGAGGRYGYSRYGYNYGYSYGYGYGD